MKITIKVTLAVMGFFAVVAGMLAWGIITHKEPGLMTLCWPAKGDGFAFYSDDCTYTIKWQKMPLKVHVDLEGGMLPYASSIKEAMHLWNKEVGPVFVTADEQQANVIIQWGPAGPGNSAGFTQHIGNKNGVKQAVVTFTDPSDLHAMYRFAVHELGHVLGLAHDSATRSIMFPIQPEMTDKLDFVLPSDADIKLLKNLYFN